MDLAVEKWLRNQNFDEESLKLFDESIICYKADAYRAGLLFSYLGTQSVIKSRIFEAECPDGVAEFFWNDINKDLLNDDKWETTVWLALTSKKHGEIFKIGDAHLKTQLEYWRGIRNDCAHAKDNEIIAAHIESYWAFIRSNLPKLVVSGGKDSIINRIRRHFDPKYTPPKADPSPIIKDMVVGVKEEDLTEVFEELVELTKNHIDYIFGITESFPADFWIKIIELGGVTSSECLKFLKSKSLDVLDHIVEIHPHVLVFLADEFELIRSLWYDRIGRFFNPLEILASLLDSDCIPPEQTEEAIRIVINKARDTEIDPLTLQRLDSYGFSKIFREKVFVGFGRYISNFEWANDHCSLVCNYLLLRGLDKDIVTHISDTFRVPNHPFKLRDSLQRLFNEKQELSNRFTKIAEEEGITLPNRLVF